uniref:Uncharacterized protein n=1 Tax=Avena sativa TaxID=4498 RepID=A0ACD5VGN6_AVESA
MGTRTLASTRHRWCYIGPPTAKNSPTISFLARLFAFTPLYNSFLHQIAMAPIRRAAQRPDFASHPSDLELITTYLIPWVNTGERPWKFIHDADVYAARPEDLAGTYAPATASDGQEGWYFFSTLRSKNRRGQRKSRTIGWRQFFSFMTKEEGQRVRNIRSGWIMVEIGLEQEGSSDELVLCKVYRSPRKGPAPSAVESTAAAGTSGRKRKADDNNTGVVTPVLTLGTAPGAKRSTAPTAPSGRKRKDGDTNSGAVRPARGALKSTTPATAGRKKKDGKKTTSAGQLCTRCRVETAESHSRTPEDDGTEEDENRGGSETGVLEHDSTDESATPHGHEAGDSSASARTFYRFV